LFCSGGDDMSAKFKAGLVKYLNEPNLGANILFVHGSGVIFYELPGNPDTAFINLDPEKLFIPNVEPETRTYWINLYDHEVNTVHLSQSFADESAAGALPTCGPRQGPAAKVTFIKDGDEWKVKP